MNDSFIQDGYDQFLDQVGDRNHSEWLEATAQYYQENEEIPMSGFRPCKLVSVNLWITK